MKEKTDRAVLEGLLSEFVKEFMFNHKDFKSIDVVVAIPASHMGIKIDNPDEFEGSCLFKLVEDIVAKLAKANGYVRDEEGNWTFGGEDDKKVELVDGFYDYAKKLKAILGADPDVTVVYDADNLAVNICVSGCGKPDAYRTFFPDTVNLGGDSQIKVKILVNGHEKKHKTVCDETVLEEMFYDHPLVSDIVVTRFPNGKKNRLFVIFKNRTVQYVNDNFGSLFGATTTVAENLAREVLDCSGMSIWWSTESELPLAENDQEIIG